MEMAKEQLIDISTRFNQQSNQAEAITTSIKVAKHFNRNHRDILRNIRNLECSSDFSARNFALTDYIDNQGKSRPMYEMTKNGFVFLVMGFTGKTASLFKESYINAFDEMIEIIKSQNLSLIAEFNRALLIYQNASALASDAGRNLSLYGRKIKPSAAEKVAELEKQLQPLLFEDDRNHE